MNDRDNKSRARPVVVSFSGVDGAGKSTQIGLLSDHLVAAGLRASQFAFWDQAAVLTNFREFGSLAMFKGEKGIGSPEKPVRRRDKNVRSWYMTGLRLALYLLDAANLNRLVAKATAGDVDVVIFDRYLYDELANLPLGNPAVRAYVWLLLKFVRRADVAFVLDADPEAACQRKPEYPLDFVRQHRQSYIALTGCAQEIVLIPPSSPQEVHQKLVDELYSRLPHCGRMVMSARSHSSRIQQAV